MTIKQQSKPQTTKITLSPSEIGKPLLEDFCPRCFWFTKKFPIKDKHPFSSPMAGILSIADKYVKDVVKWHLQNLNQLPTWILNQLQTFYPHLDFKNIRLIRPTSWRVSLFDGACLLSGQADEIIEFSDGSLFIIDYKTAALTDYQIKLRPLYEAQLNAYAYSKIGLGGLLETLAKGLTVNFNRPVKKIERLGEGYLIHVGDEKIFSKKVVISFPFLENLSVFDSESQLCRYFSKFTSKLSPYSAFVVYGKIKKKALANFTAKHHLIIGNRNKLEGTSGYLYLSVLEQENGEFATFTVSTHTPIKLWINLDEEGVKKLKAEIERKIVKVISERFEINESDLVEVFSATPYTFKHYVNRVSLGGFSASVDTPFWSIPNNFTPFNGMYLACDHAFAGQGFMGIALGCLNLYYGLNRKVKD